VGCPAAAADHYCQPSRLRLALSIADTRTESGMQFVARVARSLHADMQAELRDLERAVATGTRDAGRGLKTELRRQVTSAGLGQRLANSWRDKHYPNQKLDAASLVYTKRRKSSVLSTRAR